MLYIIKRHLILWMYQSNMYVQENDDNSLPI